MSGSPSASQLEPLPLSPPPPSGAKRRRPMIVLAQAQAVRGGNSGTSLPGGPHGRSPGDGGAGLGQMASGPASRLRGSGVMLPTELTGAWSSAGFAERRSSVSPASTSPTKMGRGASCGDLRVAGEALSSTSLEDENRALREELARCQIDASHRRSMAAIAGGGFRGLSQSRPSLCMCDQLRAKLVRVTAELQEARYEARAGPPPVTPDLVDSGAQTDEAVGRGTSEASAQTDAPAPGRDAGVQSEAQEPLRTARAAEVQAGPGLTSSRDAATETALKLVDNSVQAAPQTWEAAAQAILPLPGSPVRERPRCREAGAQTVSSSTADSGSQTKASPPVITAAAASQTQSAAPRMDTSVQTASFEDVWLSSRPCTREFEVQTPACHFPRSHSSSQTARPSTASMSTQASPRKSTDRSTQAEDREARRREAVLKTQLVEIEAHANATAVAKLELEDALLKEREGVEVWRSLAQKQTLGQMNVTILCPRAECTVNGQRIEIDSWNPVKIREEFENKVLPRFTRIFVEEPGAGGAQKARPRPEAVERAMQEFADVFREKLAAMLSAPNAAAAAASAVAHSRVGVKAGR